MEPRPNFYLILELNPSEMDWAKVSEAIDRKQSFWSKNSNHPSQGQLYQQYRQLVPTMREELQDKEKRRLEAEACRQIRQEQERQAFRALDEAIAVLAVRGYLLRQERDKLVKDFKPTFSEEQIVRRIAVPIKDAGPRPTLPPALDTSSAREIEDRLKRLGKKDLYAFLGQNCDAPLRELLAAAEARYRDALNTDHKTAEVSAQQDLAGRCQVIFKTDAERKKYETTLALRPLQELSKTVEAAGASGQIEGKVVEHLLHKAQEKGVRKELALAWLLDLGAKRKWIVSIPQSDGEAVALQRCACGVFSSQLETACPACAGPLTRECPRCRARSPTLHKACDQCGLTVEDATRMGWLLRDADLAADRGQINVAEAHLREALVYWSGCPDAESRLDQLRQRREASDQARAKLQEEMNARRFLAAREAFAVWAQRAGQPAEAATLNRTIEQAIKKAEERLERARQLRDAGETEEAVKAFQEAVGLCEDLPGVGEERDRCPPPPPRDLSARSARGAVLLSWRTSPSPRVVAYAVARRGRSTGPPFCLGRTSATSFCDDHQIEPGASYRYSVTAVTEQGAASAAVTAGPILALAEVADLTVQPGAGEVLLSWKRPRNVRRVEVYRTEGVPPPPPVRPRHAPAGAELLPTPSYDTLRDAGLQNETTYGYRVCCVFVGEDDKEVVTLGVTRDATPCQGPPLVTDLAVKFGPKGLRVSWSNPGQFPVVVLKSARPPSLPVGQEEDPAALGRLGTRLKQVSPAAALDPQPCAGQPSYLVFTVNKFRATYAGVVRYVELDALEAVADQKQVVLRWRWPPGCVAVQIQHAGQDLGAPVRRIAGAADGSLTLALDLFRQGLQQFHARCLTRDEDRTCVAGPGREAEVGVYPPRLLTWRWEWERRGLSRRQVGVIVESDDDLSDLVCLKLVGRINEMPRSVDDGECLAEWRPGNGPDGEVHFSIVERPEGGRGAWYCRLYAEPPDGVTIKQLPAEQSILR